MTTQAPARPEARTATRVMVIGSGWHMTSGISHYTYRLSSALAGRHQVSVLLMRRLVPKAA